MTVYMNSCDDAERENSLAQDPGGQVCSIPAHPGRISLISPASSAIPLPSCQLLPATYPGSCWKKVVKAFFQLRLTSLKQGCPFTGPNVNLWSWIYRDDLQFSASALGASWLFVTCIHLHVCLILHKSEGWGSSGWLVGVFKCMTNNTESKLRNVFGTGILLTRGALVTNGDSCCVFFLFLFFFLLLKVRRCVKLNAPDNGYIKCSGDGNNYGATCEFSCIGGYELQGSPARVCQYNLGWSGVEPTCAREYFTTLPGGVQAHWFFGQWEFGKGVWGGIQLLCPRGRKLNIIFVSAASLHLELKPLPPLTALS